MVYKSCRSLKGGERERQREHLSSYEIAKLHSIDYFDLVFMDSTLNHYNEPFLFLHQYEVIRCKTTSSFICAIISCSRLSEVTLMAFHCQNCETEATKEYARSPLKTEE